MIDIKEPKNIIIVLLLISIFTIPIVVVWQFYNKDTSDVGITVSQNDYDIVYDDKTQKYTVFINNPNYDRDELDQDLKDVTGEQDYNQLIEIDREAFIAPEQLDPEVEEAIEQNNLDQKLQQKITQREQNLKPSDENVTN